MNYEISEAMDALLVKSLLGEASAAEEAQVQTWLAASPENARYYHHFRTIWEESRQLNGAPAVNADAAWERFQNRVGISKPRAKTISLSFRHVMRAAAGLIVLVGTSALLWFFWSTSSQTVRAAETTVAIELPDGSSVILNRNSSLSYPRRFSGNERTVRLEGEGFFDVTRDKAKPFVIHSGEADITVLGTSFNVKTTERRTEVIVETGVVRVGKGGREVELNPNEKGVVLHDRANPVKMKTQDALHNYYRTKSFVCNYTPLSRFVDVLSDAYGTDIVIVNPDLYNLPLTATFRQASLAEILDVLTATFPQVQIERKGDQILLK